VVDEMFGGETTETANEAVFEPVTGAACRGRKRGWKWPFGSRTRRRPNSPSEEALELSSTIGHRSNKSTDYSDANGCGQSNRKHRSATRSVAAATTTVTDGGYGWTVVGASFVAHVIADGCGFSFGVLFAELLDAFGESKGRTAWVGSLFVSIPAVCGPIAGVMTTRYGCRVTTIIGGLIAGVGCFASAYARSIAELCLTFGIIAGFGLSLVFVPSVVVVAFYFEKKRAFATGK
jgi:hypothetical protein